MAELTALQRKALALATASRARLEIQNVLRPKIKWIPHNPTAKQQVFLNLTCLEGLFGGAAGGGKSDAMLMDVLQNVDVPGYAALLMRRNFPQLEQPGSLIPRSHEWLQGTGAQWSERKKQWYFPHSGATIRFGHMETLQNKYDYASSEYQYIGFDEMTQFLEEGYTFLFSRLRRTHGAQDNISLKMRGATNPGGEGSQWVYDRFIDGADWFDGIAKKEITRNGKTTLRIFIPSFLTDNPFLDQDAYLDSLNQLDEVTRAQLLNGDWTIRAKGDIFPMWDERYHVVTWSEFENLFGVRTIPSHWKVGRFYDAGTTKEHPGVITHVARAAENGPLTGSVFVFSELLFVDRTLREIVEELVSAEERFNVRFRTNLSKMSHEASSERITLAREYGERFDAWSTDRTGGITLLRDYLEIIDKSNPHPFRPDLEGRPRMYFVVPDSQGEYLKGNVRAATNSFGLQRLRSEIPSYAWDRQNLPRRTFNDAIDTLRAAAMHFFPAIKRLTDYEKLEVSLPEHLKAQSILSNSDLIAQTELAIVRQIEVNQHKRKVKRYNYRPPWL